MNQRGFAPLLIVISVLLLAGGAIGGGYYIKEHTQLFSQASEATQPMVESSTPPTAEVTSSPIAISSPIASGKPIPADWKELIINSCKISLRYPSDSKIELYEQGTGCRLKIYFGPETPSHSFDIVSYPKQSFSENRNPKNAILVDNTPGILLENSNVFWILKENIDFTGGLPDKKLNPETREIAEQVLYSIRFIGTKEDYITPQPDFMQHVNENDVLQRNADTLADGIRSHYELKGVLPETLDQLYVADHIGQYPQSDTNNIALYTYKKNGTDYSVSVTLHNGSLYIAEGSIANIEPIDRSRHYSPNR